ncbi:hypothetical protein ACH48_18925 [Aeromonas caviae]|nr:hypothetical protein ACH48_18925 [Aeromonas caviae]
MLTFCIVTAIYLGSSASFWDIRWVHIYKLLAVIGIAFKESYGINLVQLTKTWKLSFPKFYDCRIKV